MIVLSALSVEGKIVIQGNERVTIAKTENGCDSWHFCGESAIRTNPTIQHPDLYAIINVTKVFVRSTRPGRKT